MALFKGRGTQHGGSGKKRSAAESASDDERWPSRAQPEPGAKPAKAPKARGPRGKFPFRFYLWLLGGIAVMTVAGYLVAALYLFPSPLMPNERAVPRVVGMTQREATRQLEAAGFTTSDSAEGHTLAAAGLVTWQDPPSGVTAPRGHRVRLVVSSGPPQVMVPDIRGLDVELARLLLEAAGLRIEGIDTVDVKSGLTGIAVSTLPAAGDSVRFGRGVIVHLAR